MKTWGTLKTEIQAECNIEGDEFVSDTELMTWAQDAKDEAEAEIVSLYDKYLETSAAITMTAGVSTITPPVDLYANKVTGIWFDDGSSVYEVKLIKRKEQIHSANSNDRYQYYFKNSAVGGVTIQLVPAPRETSSTLLTCYYIRESAALVDDSSVMDLPIADAFIKQYVKDKVQEKELGPTGSRGRSQLLEKQKNLLIEALNQMVPDDSSDEIAPDLSFYDDMEGYL